MTRERVRELALMTWLNALPTFPGGGERLMMELSEAGADSELDKSSELLRRSRAPAEEYQVRRRGRRQPQNIFPAPRI